MDTILLLYEYDILTKELTLLYNYGNKLKTLEGDTVFLFSDLISSSLNRRFKRYYYLFNNYY
jgi:hypothetical protein